MAADAAEGAGGNFRPRVLQVTTSDAGGGAAAVALSLHKEFRERGLLSWLAVGKKWSTEKDVFEIPNHAGRATWERTLARLADRLEPFRVREKKVWHLQRLFRAIGNPKRAWLRARGTEDFDYPGTWRLLQLPPSKPDVVQMHNLHGDYFDLRVLPWISMSVPTVLTLHDAWMLSGHCAHSFDCRRWMTGCGSCPYLTIPVAVPRDDTANNWKRKAGIYKRSELYVVTPSQWLMDKVERSMLEPATLGKRVIPNGVDLSVFRPGDKANARAKLDLPEKGLVLLFAANGIRANPWKDYATMRAAVELLGDEAIMENAVFLALGEEGPSERIGRATVRFEKFRDSPNEVAEFYRAADIYIHAARADTFPNTVIEALACGTPVIATAVGGIPEQVKSLNTGEGTANGATGILVEPAHPEDLAAAVRLLAGNPEMRMEMGGNAAADARERFSLETQAAAYERLYSDALRERAKKQVAQ